MGTDSIDALLMHASKSLQGRCQSMTIPEAILRAEFEQLGILQPNVKWYDLLGRFKNYVAMRDARNGLNIHPTECRVSLEKVNGGYQWNESDLYPGDEGDVGMM